MDEKHCQVRASFRVIGPSHLGAQLAFLGVLPGAELLKLLQPSADLLDHGATVLRRTKKLQQLLKQPNDVATDEKHQQCPEASDHEAGHRHEEVFEQNTERQKDYPDRGQRIQARKRRRHEGGKRKYKHERPEDHTATAVLEQHP
jgi:hypothetical protein